GVGDLSQALLPFRAQGQVVLQHLAGQITQPGGDLSLQVSMGQIRRAIPAQPVQRDREQLPCRVERVPVGLQRVRLHPGTFFCWFGVDSQTVEKELPSTYRSAPSTRNNLISHRPSREGAAPKTFRPEPAPVTLMYQGRLFAHRSPEHLSLVERAIRA